MSDPSKDLGLEWAGVGDRVDAAAVLEPTHSGESGIVLALENIPVWPLEVVHMRACSQMAGYFDQEVQEVDTHPCPHADQHNLGSVHTEEGPGSAHKLVAEEVAGILHIHTETHESAILLRRATWKVVGTVVVRKAPGE